MLGGGMAMPGGGTSEIDNQSGLAKHG